MNYLSSIGLNPFYNREGFELKTCQRVGLLTCLNPFYNREGFELLTVGAYLYQWVLIPFITGKVLNSKRHPLKHYVLS